MSTRFKPADSRIDDVTKSATNQLIADNSVHFKGNPQSKKETLRPILKHSTTNSDKGVDNETFTNIVYNEDNVSSEDDDDLTDDSESVSMSEINAQSVEEEYEPDRDVSGERSFKSQLKDYVEILKSTGKIEKVALIDLNGKVLPKCVGMSITEEEAFAVLCILKSPDKSLAKIRIGNKDYTCFKNSSNSVVGKAENDFLHVRSCLDFIIICISDPNSPGSCIYEVTRFVKRCNRTSNNSSNERN